MRSSDPPAAGHAAVTENEKGAALRPWRTGSALILFTLIMPTVLIPMVGLAIDGTMLFTVKAKLSAAVDGGAIAAARMLSAGLSFDEQRDSATRTAEQFVRANFPDGYWGSGNLAFDPPVEVREDSSSSFKRRTVRIVAEVETPLLFMRILGQRTARVRAAGMAARRDVRMVLILDRSSSMTGVIDTLKNAAIDFVNRFAEGRDQVGLVVYGGSAIVAFPPRDPADPGAGTGPAGNFKSASPSVSALIGSINSGSNTGTAEALWLGYQELTKDPLPGALNLIVLFTDGLPNGITATFNDPDPASNAVAAGSPCKHKNAQVDGGGQLVPSTAMTGFIAQWSGFALNGTVAGVMELMNRTENGEHPNVTRWLNTPQERVISTGGAEDCACHPEKNKTKVPQDLRRIPPVDAYGNATDGTGYIHSSLFKAQHVPLNMNRVYSPYHIGLASWNAADDAARRIRADNTLNPVIYIIGYNGGSEVPDPVLMKRIANVDDPENAAYDPGKPAGLYVMAPTPAQLAAAFGRVASEILRLSM